MTKLEILMEIKKADDELIDWSNSNPKIDPMKLKKVELMSLLGSIRNVKTLLEKCQVKGDN
jgi:hypothetical protein